MSWYGEPQWEIQSVEVMGGRSLSHCYGQALPLSRVGCNGSLKALSVRLDLVHRNAGSCGNRSKRVFVRFVNLAALDARNFFG